MAFHIYKPNASDEEISRLRREKQREFVKELSKAFEEEMLKAVEKVPDDWNGIELRLLAKLIVEDRLSMRTDSARKRKVTRICNERCIP